MFGAIQEWTEDIFMPLGGVGIFLVAFFSSTFLIVPPDIILALMCLHDTGDVICLWYALICTIGSVLGGVFGYYLGYHRGRPFLEKFLPEEKVDQVEEAYARWGMWAIGIAGFTPVPYNVFTVSSGVMKYDLKKFILMSLLSRGTRFFIVAFLIMMWGEVMYEFLFDHFVWIFTAATAVVIVLFVERERLREQWMKYMEAR